MLRNERPRSGGLESVPTTYELSYPDDPPGSLINGTERTAFSLAREVRNVSSTYSRNGGDNGIGTALASGHTDFSWLNATSLTNSSLANPGSTTSTTTTTTSSTTSSSASILASSTTITDNYTSITDLFVFDDLNDYINRLNYSAFANLTGYYDSGSGSLNLSSINASCGSILQGDGAVRSAAGQCNSTIDEEKTDANNWWALILVIVPCLTLFGNVLVILAVVRERALQTVTNYFIVSLAIADLLVAVLVMPFAVYVLVSRTWTS